VVYDGGAIASTFSKCEGWLRWMTNIKELQGCSDYGNSEGRGGFAVGKMSTWGR
jgi:hypothetical protein